MQINHPKNGADYYKAVGNLRTGDRITRTLLTGKEGEPNNYKVNLGGGEENSGEWTSPRHRHPFDQIRFPIAGSYAIGKDDFLDAGWVAYFPEGAYYGPQVKASNLVMLSVQFGGANGDGYYSMRQRKKAYEDLVAKGGKFQDGAYTWTDAGGKKHNQDAGEALWEQFSGRELKYRQPRYRDVILMNPATFAWAKDAEQQGVGRKELGLFTERRIKVEFVRVDKGAILEFGRERAPEILFLTEGQMAHDNRTHEKHTAFATEPTETPVSLTAVEPSELLYVKLPTF